MTDVAVSVGFAMGIGRLGSTDELAPANARRGGTVRRKAGATIVKPIHLRGGESLRIRNGGGSWIYAVGGVVWITEEGSPHDHVLTPGDAARLSKPGTAIVHAYASARLVFKVPSDTAAPRSIIKSFARDGTDRPVTLQRPITPTASTWPERLSAVLARIRAIGRALSDWLERGRIDAPAQTAEEWRSMTYAEGMPSRHLRRQRLSSLSGLVTDEYLIWRI